MSEELYYIDYMNFPILMVDISIVLAYICRIKTTGYTALVLEIPDRSVLEKIIYFFLKLFFKIYFPSFKCFSIWRGGGKENVTKVLHYFLMLTTIVFIII